MNWICFSVIGVSPVSHVKGLKNETFCLVSGGSQLFLCVKVFPQLHAGIQTISSFTLDLPAADG